MAVYTGVSRAFKASVDTAVESEFTEEDKQTKLMITTYKEEQGDGN